MKKSSASTTGKWITIGCRSAGFGLLAIIIIAAAGQLSACSGQLTEEEIQVEAPRIHDEAWIVDTHVDSPIRGLRDSTWNADERHEDGSWDIPRMIEGGADAVFQVVYFGQGDLTEEAFADVHERALGVFEWIHNMADASPYAEFAATVADAERLHREGKRAIFIGVENGYPIGTDINNVEKFYNLGMRYMTLSHSDDNQISASSGGPQDREDFGLTDFGRQVVAEMNRLGVMIDGSHISDKTFFDVVEISKAPVIASHSACDGINEHARNFSDEMLLALKENGGTIQLLPLASFIRQAPENPEFDRAMAELQEEFGERRNLSGERLGEFMQRRNELRQQYPSPPATIDDYIKHIDYAVNLIGIDHIGFGSDFDGGGGVENLEDISMLPNLTVELLRRGYSEQDLKKFWGGNLLRVMREVEAVAEK